MTDFWKDIWDTKGDSTSTDLLFLDGYEHLNIEFNSQDLCKKIARLGQFEYGEKILEVGCGCGFLARECQIHYALDAPPEWTDPKLREVALIHLSDGIDAVSKSSNEAERGMLPETPTICVGQPTALDPTRCPTGKSILWIQIPDAPSTIKGDAAGIINGGSEWDNEITELFADRVESLLKNHIKNFTNIKLQRQCYSPIQLSKLNINLVGGDPYGGACSIDQFFLWRPFNSSINNETVVKNLHHIGASTHPGPGLSGGAGFNLAKRLGA